MITLFLCYVDLFLLRGVATRVEYTLACQVHDRIEDEFTGVLPMLWVIIHAIKAPLPEDLSWANPSVPVLLITVVLTKDSNTATVKNISKWNILWRYWVLSQQ